MKKFKGLLIVIMGLLCISCSYKTKSENDNNVESNVGEFCQKDSAC